MPLPLREPFFLQGRTSVVQRAVIMSAVLGGLAWVAAWPLAVVTELTEVPEDLPLVFGLSWGVVTGLLIYAPLNYWNRRHIAWAGFAAVCECLLVVLWPDTTAYSGEVRVVIHTFLQLAFGGLLLIRATRVHCCAYFVTMCAAALPLSFVFLHDDMWLSDNLQDLGVPIHLIKVALFACHFWTQLAALAIPWGIPFWWPPRGRESP